MDFFDQIAKAANYAGEEIAKNAGYAIDQAGQSVGAITESAGYLGGAIVHHTGQTIDQVGKLVIYQAEEASKLIDKDLASTVSKTALEAAAGTAASIAVRALATATLGGAAAAPVATLLTAVSILAIAQKINQNLNKSIN